MGEVFNLHQRARPFGSMTYLNEIYGWFKERLDLRFRGLKN